jgi:hypothetical protein
MSILGIAKGVLGAVTGGLTNAAFSGWEDSRQLEQQGKLNSQQEQSANRLADAQYKRNLAMWKETNYSAQLAEMEKAGLSPGLIYGGGGGGGTTAQAGSTPMPQGGRAGDPNNAVANSINLGMQKAQMEVLETQAQKNKAEAEKIAGVDTRQGAANATAIEFQNGVNKLIGEEKYLDNAVWANRKLATETSKTMNEYEAWKAANFKGEAADSQNSPLAKAQAAGLEKALVDLKNAKATNNLIQAETTIKNFTAELTKQGIAEGTPWYVKFMADLLNKAGLNVSDTAKKVTGN